VTHKESRIVQLLFGQSKLEGLSSSHPAEEKKTERKSKRERKGERDSEREGKCHLNRFPRASAPLGHRPKRMPNKLARHPHAKWKGNPVGMGGTPGEAL
jgi:hypothetical protein